ncbi:DUF4079 domain-containing protein [Synechococcus sp. MIT S9503]|uniref:DUF4079 domain-containing protein n=1 Tax=Synechococcus sp. MIT S9503 TaxID=3082547 RepID=UPI0039A663AC
MIAALQPLTPLQWLALVHPVLIILFVYPVIGATIRLGILARERRLEINPIAPTVPIEHVDHGRWATAGLLLAVLFALSHDLADVGVGFSSWAVAILQATGVVVSFVALLRTRRLALRLLFSWSCWLFLLLITIEPSLVSRRSLAAAEVWQSHTWGGLLLIAFLLLTMACQREIAGRLWMRRIHVALNILVALLLATQAITGTRDLLLG